MPSSALANAPQPRKYLAVIPARGGSKRLPGKNVRSFGGYPLIAHSIEYAKSCPSIGRIVVSTDSEDIAQVARRHGAEVIVRPAELATDKAKTGSAIKHVLETLAEQHYYPHGVVTLQPTTPLRPPTLLRDALAVYERDDADSVISVSRSTHKLGTLVDGSFRPTSYRVEQRSQDLSPQFFENGLIYITQPDIILKDENVFGTDIRAFEISEPYAELDIDEEIHFIIGERLFEQFRHVFMWMQ